MLDQLPTVVRRTPAQANGTPTTPPATRNGHSNGQESEVVAPDTATSGTTPSCTTPSGTTLPGTETAAPAAVENGRLSEEQYRGLWSWAKKTAKKAVDSVSFDDVKSVVAAGLPAAGTAIGGFFGGPAGAAIGGKAGGFAGGYVREVPPTTAETQAAVLQAVEAREVEAAQLSAIVDQIVEPALLVVIDEMERDASERASRGDAGPADDEVMERFWKKAFGKVAGALADELPWAITKATQYLGLDGSRGANAIDPLMLDSETAARFWGPAFGKALAAIQSTVPQLFEQFAGGFRDADDNHVTWPDVSGTTRLARGDNLTVTSQEPIDDPDSVEIALEIPPHKAWWKAIQVRGADDRLLGVAEVAGEAKTSRVRVSAAALRTPGACLVFTKATGSYVLPASELPAVGGQRLGFYWYAG